MLLFPSEIMLFTLFTVCEGILEVLHSFISNGVPRSRICAEEMAMEGEDSTDLI